jgi:hypothetical protein
MALKPDVHIYGKTNQVAGIAADGVSGLGEPMAIVEIALCGYGSQVPGVTSDGNIGRLTNSIIAATDGTWTTDVYNNSNITPAGTYYVVTIKDENGDIAQVKAFRVTAGGSFDFETIAPIDPDQPPPVIPTPPPVSELLYVAAANGMTFDGSDYTAFTTTLPGDVTSSAVQNMVAGNLYTFIIRQDGTGGHSFQWPAGCQGATNANPQANGTAVQTFVAFDSDTLFAIAPGTYLP